MSLKKELIYIYEKDETNRIEKYSYKGDRCVIVFKNNSKEFSYGKKQSESCKDSIKWRQSI